MAYLIGYVVFGVLFVVGGVGYWVITRPFAAADEIYEPSPHEAEGQSSPTS